MILFPIRKPRLGLSLSGRSLTLVELRRGWTGTRLHHVKTATLPPGLVRTSLAERSLADVPALAQEMGRLSGKRPRRSSAIPVALSLPDLWAKVALFEFDSWPRKVAEREAVIRWRVQKECLLPNAETRLVYQVYRVPGRSSPSPDEPKAAPSHPVRVLVLVLRRDTLGQIEEACELAGLLPVSIGLHSFLLFDLCRPVLANAGRTLGGKNGRPVFFLSLADENFAFLAVQHGAPAFCRIKPLRRNEALPQEVLATIQFLGDRDFQHGAERENAQRPLIMVGNPEFGHLFSEDRLAPAAPVTVKPVAWNDLRLGRSASSLTPPWTALPAVAGLLAGGINT